MNLYEQIGEEKIDQLVMHMYDDIIPNDDNIRFLQKSIILLWDFILYFFANDLMLIFSFIYSSTTFFLNSKLYLVIKIPTSKKLDFLV